jgi:RND superfamily putative drug exporter
MSKMLSLARWTIAHLKLFGLALATAVSPDAIVIRTILLPAVLELLGRRTWAFPRWLDRRLPHVAIEPGGELEPALAEAA